LLERKEKEGEKRAQQQEEGLDPYSIFVFAMKSQVTRRKYTGRFIKLLDFIGIPQGTIENRCKSFTDKAQKDSKWALNNIIRFLQAQRQKVEQKEITAATLNNYVKSIKLFCEVVEIPISWKNIVRGLPKARRYADDRAPTLEEIRRIMEYPDRRIKAIVCTMASSDIRLGAWDDLKWKHIQPVRKENEGKIIAAKVIVYSGDVEEYFTFITPEAYYELEKWMNYRKDSGEPITGESWLMRNVWDIKRGYMKGMITIPKKLKSTGVKRLVEDALWSQSVRKKLEDGKKRHDFQSNHGFRKWFKTQCELAGMKSINIEILMGHSIGISNSYYKITEKDLLKDYLKAIDSLSILEENKLKVENQRVKQNNNLLEREKNELSLLREKLAPLLELKDTLIKEGILQEDNNNPDEEEEETEEKEEQ
jgi:integrase